MTFVPRSAEELALTFPPQLEHVSASSLAMAIRCEEQWRQRYILGKRLPPALAPILGRADHKAIAYGLQSKLDTGDLPGVGEVRDVFLHELESEVGEVGGLSELEVSKAESMPAKRKIYDTGRKQGQELVGMYHSRVSPQLSPVAVEQRFDVELPGLPVTMNGYLDLMVELSPQENIIIDRKRVTRTSHSPKPDWSLQAEIYQLVEQLPFAWHLSVAKAAPEIVMGPELFKAAPPYERSLRFVQQIVQKLGFLYMKYGPEEPWPTTGKLHPWACGYCGYRPECWGWQE